MDVCTYVLRKLRENNTDFFLFLFSHHLKLSLDLLRLAHITCTRGVVHLRRAGRRLCWAARQEAPSPGRPAGEGSGKAAIDGDKDGGPGPGTEVTCS